MPLPEYALTWLKEFDDSSEPVDYSMISLIVDTRLRERQTPSDEVKAIFRVLAPLEFHIRPRGGSPWNCYFAPRHSGDPAGGDADYPNLSDLDAAAVEAWAALAGRLNNPALKARFADAVWELGERLSPGRRDRYRFAGRAAECYLKAAQEGRYGNPGMQLQPMARAVIENPPPERLVAGSQDWENKWRHRRVRLSSVLDRKRLVCFRVPT